WRRRRPARRRRLLPVPAVRPGARARWSAWRPRWASRPGRPSPARSLPVPAVRPGPRRPLSGATSARPPSLDYTPPASLTPPRALPGDAGLAADRCAIQESSKPPHDRKICRYANRQGMRRAVVLGAAGLAALLGLWHPARVAVQALLLLPALFPLAPLGPLGLMAMPAPDARTG